MQMQCRLLQITVMAHMPFFYFLFLLTGISTLWKRRMRDEKARGWMDGWVPWCDGLFVKLVLFKYYCDEDKEKNGMVSFLFLHYSIRIFPGSTCAMQREMWVKYMVCCCEIQFIKLFELKNNLFSIRFITSVLSFVFFNSTGMLSWVRARTERIWMRIHMKNSGESKINLQ